MNSNNSNSRDRDTVPHGSKKRWKDEVDLSLPKISEVLQTAKNTARDEYKGHKPLLYIKSKPNTFFQIQKSTSLLCRRRKIQVFSLTGFLQHQISN